MSRALITEAYLTDIADAIRAKNGSSDTYTPPQMAAAIQAIPTGADVDVEALTVTTNGIYTAPSGKAYSPVTVSVPTSGISIQANFRGQAFIDGTSVINWTNSNYPQYQQFWLDLQPYIGKTIKITNTGRRNFYGYTSQQPATRMELNAERRDSGGQLSVTYDGGNDRYLVYDFASSFDGGRLIIEVN